MSGVYGEAAAGGRTAQNLILWGEHPATARDAWWASGQLWSAFAAGMALVLAAKQNPGLEALAKKAAEAMALFDDSMSWLAGPETLESWAAAQQSLRDFASEVVAVLGQAPPPPAEPPPPPPPSSSAWPWILGGGLGLALVGGTIGVVALRRRKTP